MTCTSYRAVVFSIAVASSFYFSGCNYVMYLFVLINVFVFVIIVCLCVQHVVHSGMVSGSVLAHLLAALDRWKSCKSVPRYTLSAFRPLRCGIHDGMCFWNGSWMFFFRFWHQLGHPGGAQVTSFGSFSRVWLWKLFFLSFRESPLRIPLSKYHVNGAYRVSKWPPQPPWAPTADPEAGKKLLK